MKLDVTLEHSGVTVSLSAAVDLPLFEHAQKSETFQDQAPEVLDRAATLGLSQVAQLMPRVHQQFSANLLLASLELSVAESGKDWSDRITDAATLDTAALDAYAQKTAEAQEALVRLLRNATAKGEGSV